MHCSKCHKPYPEVTPGCTCESVQRASLVTQIELLYPADSHSYGQHLLLKALCASWRNLPLGVLTEYLALCIEKEAENHV